jgi:predicted nucleotidyltransferase
MFPTGLFETTTQRKILRILAEKNRKYTIEELAELCHRSEASISRALQNAARYPYIEKSRVPQSKQLTFRLDPDSQYTAAIRDFFKTEYERERQNGTIPVDIWNLLEDTTDTFENQVNEIVELFLFGSYATGNYYAGSDIDLLVVHHPTETDIKDSITQMTQKVGDERLQVIIVELPNQEMADEEILETVQNRSPVSGIDVIIPLTGEVTT